MRSLRRNQLNQYAERPTPRDIAIRALKSAIVQALTKSPGLTTREIWQAIGVGIVDTRRLQRHLDRLIGRGVVRREGAKFFLCLGTLETCDGGQVRSEVA